MLHSCVNEVSLYPYPSLLWLKRNGIGLDQVSNEAEWLRLEEKWRSPGPARS